MRLLLAEDDPQLGPSLRERLIAAGAVRLGVSRTPQIVEDDTTLVTATVLNKPPKG